MRKLTETERRVTTVESPIFLKVESYVRPCEIDKIWPFCGSVSGESCYQVSGPNVHGFVSVSDLGRMLFEHE